jgi:hypothetical protein
MSLESIFPRLAITAYRTTSSATILYNCFAWAAGESHRWWEAHPDAGHFWPTGFTEDWSIDVLRIAFASCGYGPCPNGALESGMEKVAIYILDGEPMHAARQLSSGMWTSKLGVDVDIEHTLDGLIGLEYGQPEVFLSRPTQP